MFQSVLRVMRGGQAERLESTGAPEGGFTLIELMVVLLIIAILLAIAIPTFLGVTSSANDRATQSNLTNALTEATAQYQSAGQTFAGIQTLLSSSAPEYTWNGPRTACTTGETNCISVDPDDLVTSGDNQAVVLAALSKAGTCWFVAQLQAAPQAITSTGFITLAFNSTLHFGMELQGTTTAPAYTPATATANVSTAGTYYAKLLNPGASQAHCEANYAELDTAAFVWGPSFSSPGINAT